MIVDWSDIHLYSQENGQMKYGGPPPYWNTVARKPVGKGSEVFISRLPRDASLPQICPIFAQVGEIYAARLMMDFSGTNRGFCFIQYTTKLESKWAIEKLNSYEIRWGQRISVTKSIDNCRLFIGQVPKHLQRIEIRQIVEAATDGVKDVLLYLSPTDKSFNRGFCFIEYENHRSAAMARRTLIAAGIPEWGKEIRIDWAIPEEDIDENVMANVTVIYVRNLMLRTTETSLKEVICKVVPLSDLTRIRKVKDFAFVHFKNRGAAELAIVFLNGFILDGAELITTWAKPSPVDESSKSINFTIYSGKNDKDNNYRIDTRKKYNPPRYNDVDKSVFQNKAVDYSQARKEMYGSLMCSSPLPPAFCYSPAPDKMIIPYSYQQTLSPSVTSLPSWSGLVGPVSMGGYGCVSSPSLQASHGTVDPRASPNTITLQALIDACATPYLTGDSLVFLMRNEKAVYSPGPHEPPQSPLSYNLSSPNDAVPLPNITEFDLSRAQNTSKISALQLLN